MLIYAGKNFTASHAGVRIEEVACEKCKTRFFYQLKRVGNGQGSAPYFLAQDSARNRAERAAQRNLEKRLSREAEMVPCPRCHWVNHELIERYRRCRYTGAWVWIVIIMFCALLAAIAAEAGLGEVMERHSNAPTIAFFTVLGIGLLSPVCVLLIRARLRSAIDPNVTYPRRPTLPVGTPPALVEATDPKTGEAILQPAVAQEDLIDKDGWATFSPGELEFVPACCVCLEEAMTHYKSPFVMNERDKQVPVPLCRACARRLRMRWWLTALAVIVVAAGGSALFALSWPKVDAFGRWFGGGAIALFVSLFAVALIPNQVCRPYWMKVIDADRGIWKFKAKNPEYTRMLVGEVE
jgi:hypothetical protein